MFSQSRVKNFIGKVLFFTSGACTEFPGKIVDENSPIRSHKDIYDLEAPFFLRHQNSIRFCLTLQMVNQ